MVAAISVALAAALKPQPHSDWLYYWLAAEDLTLYQRGGGGLALLALLKESGASPVVASLCINLVSAIALLSVAYRLDSTAWKWYAQLVAGMLLVTTPYYGIVQLDLLATAFLALAIASLAGRTRPPRIAAFACAILLCAVAVSTKPQLALVIWAMVLLLFPVRWWTRARWTRAADMLFIVMVLGSMIGFAADYATRVVAGQRDSMRTTSAVTLYAGLLVSGEGRGCGYWSVEAAEAAKADMGKTLAQSIAARLAEESPGHWANVVACKAPQILLPPSFGLYWLVESPNVRAALDARPDRASLERWYARALWLERLCLVLLEIAILAAAFLTACRNGKRATGHAAIAAGWILAFWAVHAVFEIQGRYFLPMLVVAPMLSALAARRIPELPTATGSSGHSGKIAPVLEVQ